eukprot:scaffold144045_cov13-Tisochrysis_lutea.AAC.1
MLQHPLDRVHLLKVHPESTHAQQRSIYLNLFASRNKCRSKNCKLHPNTAQFAMNNRSLPDKQYYQPTYMPKHSHSLDSQTNSLNNKRKKLIHAVAKLTPSVIDPLSLLCQDASTL